MVAEDLVAAFGPGVVVAVALEVEQEDVGEEVVGVPAVFRAGAFVAAVFELATVEAVVFEVVDDLQQVEGELWPRKNTAPSQPKATVKAVKASAVMLYHQMSSLRQLRALWPFFSRRLASSFQALMKLRA